MRSNANLESVIAFSSGFLPLSSLAALRTTSRGMKQVLLDNEPEFTTLSLSKTTLDAAPNAASYQVFAVYGMQLQNLTVGGVGGYAAWARDVLAGARIRAQAPVAPAALRRRRCAWLQCYIGLAAGRGRRAAVSGRHCWNECSGSYAPAGGVTARCAPAAT
jgi:hypothetical protein